MARAHSLAETERYIPLCDRNEPTERQTVFLLPSLSARAIAKIHDYGARLEGQVAVAQLGSLQYAAAKFGCHGWENLLDDQGQLVAVETTFVDGVKCLTEESLDRVPHLISEIGTRVLARHRLTESEQGKSESSPKSPPGG